MIAPYGRTGEESFDYKKTADKRIPRVYFTTTKKRQKSIILLGRIIPSYFHNFHSLVDATLSELSIPGLK